MIDRIIVEPQTNHTTVENRDLVQKIFPHETVTIYRGMIVVDVQDALYPVDYVFTLLNEALFPAVVWDWDAWHK